MKTKITPFMLLLAGVIAPPSRADLVPNGEFNITKPDEPEVIGTLSPGGDYVPWNPPNLPLALSVRGGDGLADFSDGSQGNLVDLLGWSKVQGNADLVPNGMDGSTGMNLFAAWGGDSRIESAEPLGTVVAGAVYTISVMVDGPPSGPIAGPLAFHLLADGVRLTPTSSVEITAPDAFGVFQEISRTYEGAAIADHLGAELTIELGVEDENDIPNRVIFDDVSFEGTGDGPEFAITEILYDPGDGKVGPSVTLTWNSTPGEPFVIQSSTDLTTWALEVLDGISDDGETTTRTFELAPFGLADLETLYFRVEEQPAG